ncbi:MAG: hypothetical protein WCV55_03075 [Candidatus Paceibacterota bacterium]
MFTVKRAESNPQISPIREHFWEATATFNWCPVKNNKTTYVVYRAVSDNEIFRDQKIQLSVIARAETLNGKDFKNREPFIIPEKDYEKFGCEDPRVTKLGDTYYIFYTALSEYPFTPDSIKVAVALSKDMKTVQEKHLVTPFNAKAMALFPEKINGKMAALLTVNTDLPPSEIAYAEFDDPEEMYSESFWNKWYEKLPENALKIRRNKNEQIELGAPPLKTEKGWLVIYSHISKYTEGRPIFGIEVLLLDLKDPKIILGRTHGPIMVPETYYELTGFVPNVVFPSGALITGNKLEIYYGAADTHCAIASIPLDNLLNSLDPQTKKPVERFSNNPILSLRPGKKFEEGGVLNPAAIDLGGKVHLLYRASTNKNVSTIGYASSKDGVNIDERSEKPIYEARTNFEGKGRTENGGCEDPRISQIGDKLYMTYTAYDGKTPQVAVTSISCDSFLKKEWDKWSEPRAVSIPGVGDKDACLVDEKINNEYYIFHRIDGTVCMDSFSTLDFSEQKINKCIEIIGPRMGTWESLKVGVACPPIKTKLGWLVFYHGISETKTYRIGAALLDLKNPTTIKARLATPILEPEKDYEMKGVVSKVVFPCGAIVRKGIIYLYYGGADKVVCGAKIELETVLKMLKVEK